MERYLEAILLEADKRTYSEEAYELVFSTALANSLWLEGDSGWPLTPFDKMAELLEKALSFANKVSHDFNERAIVEAKVLSTKVEDIFEIVNNLKACRMHDSFRGEILCLKQLLDVHTGQCLSKYHWPENMFEFDDRRVEEMMMDRKLSIETFFYCCICLKKKMEALAGTVSELNGDSEIDKFILSYLGVGLLDGTYVLLMPKAEWVKEISDESNGSLDSIDFQGLLPINYQDLAASADRCLSQQLTAFTIKSCTHLYEIAEHSEENSFSDDLHFTTYMHLFEAVQYSESCNRRLRREVSTELEKFRMDTITEFSEYLGPLGWNTGMTKDTTLIRKSETCIMMATEYLREKIGEKYRLSDREMAFTAQMILSTPNLKKNVYVNVDRKLKDKKMWSDFIRTYEEEASELAKFLALFHAVKDTKMCSEWMEEEDIEFAFQQLYMIERLLSLTSIAYGTSYLPQATLAELLLQYDDESILLLSSLSDIEPNVLKDIHIFLAKFLAEFAKKINSASDSVTDYLPFAASRVTLCACLLHLIFGEHLDLLNDTMTSHLPSKIMEVLKGRKDKEVFARAFEVDKNPFQALLKLPYAACAYMVRCIEQPQIGAYRL